MHHTSDRLANLLGTLALAVTDQLTGAMDEAAGQGGGGPAALVQLAGHPGLTIEELRRRIGLSHSAVVRMVDRLAARGLVSRGRDAGDARAARLRLTPAGEELAGSVLAVRKQVTADIVGRLTPERQRELASLLAEMLAEIPQGSEEGTRVCRLCCLRDCPADLCPVEIRYQELLSEGR